MRDFIHLHLHTQYSLLDGAIKIKELTERLKELNMRSVAVTDHGSMHGVIDFYTSCKKAGIKPIIGFEAYVSPTVMSFKTYTNSETSNYHLVLLAKNNTGFYNLLKLCSLGYTEGFYRKPRIDKKALLEHREGIIALSACLGGEIPQKIMRESHKEAKETALEYLEIMGEGNFYLELQVNDFPDQKIVNNQLVMISSETGIPLVATGDCHFLNKGDDKYHNLLMCIQYNETLQDLGRKEHSSASAYVKSAEEMYEAFKEYPEEALLNTVKIAELCNIDLSHQFGSPHLPHYEVPADCTQEDYLRELVQKGFEERIQHLQGQAAHSEPAESASYEEYKKRLEKELEIIILKGFHGYFLIVWDFIKYAREQNIPVGPGRGSGVGSLVAYCLKITDLDPIQHGLLFERFLNPERTSLPDFDIDFCPNGREQVVDYVRRRYGEDKVATIATFSALAGRSVIRDVCRAIPISLAEADKYAKSIPHEPGMTLSKAMEEKPSLKRELPEAVVEYSLKLEGLLRQSGTHAAGIVIADKPLTDYLPLYKDKFDKISAQYDKHVVEDIGLVKFDFLGLATLTIIEGAARRVKREVDESFDIDAIPFDDKDVYEMLSRGESDGVFQLESGGMRELMKRLKPSCFADLVALNALYRPGPLKSGVPNDYCDSKHGLKRISYILPQLEPILKETYGFIIYQEQVMQIAVLLAGYSLAAADELRSAMGKKIKDKMEKHRNIFLNGDAGKNIPGAVANGVNQRKAEEIYELMSKFAEYGFNKSHAAAYAKVAYQTAYLRKRYTAQFFAALLSNVDNPDRISQHIAAAVKAGMTVAPPDINKSGLEFECVDGELRFGLASIKNIGAWVVEEILKERAKGGPFRSIYNLCERVEPKSMNKKVLEALIYSGALDSFGKKRAALVECQKRALDQGQAYYKQKEAGIQTIDDFLYTDEERLQREEYKIVEEFPAKDILAYEKDLLFHYFTAHPITSATELAGGLFSTVAEAAASREAEITLLVFIAAVHLRITNKNDPSKKQEEMAVLTLEDTTGNLEAVVFPREYRGYKEFLEVGEVVVVTGSFKRSFEVRGVSSLSEGIARHAKGLVIHLDENSTGLDDLYSLEGILTENAGALPVEIVVDGADYNFEIPLPRNFGVAPTEDFFERLNRESRVRYALKDRGGEDGLKYNFRRQYKEDEEEEWAE